MKITCLPASAIIVVIFTLSAFSQSTIVINTPGEESPKSELSVSEKRLMDRSVLPKVRKRLAGEGCEESVDISGIVHGAFTKPAANQTFVFYQFCQTGNGLGSVGAAVFEGNKVVANLVSEESG